MTKSFSIRCAYIMLTITTSNVCLFVKATDFSCRKVDMKFQHDDSWLFGLFVIKRNTTKIDWICDSGCVLVGTACFPSCLHTEEPSK